MRPAARSNRLEASTELKLLGPACSGLGLPPVARIAGAPNLAAARVAIALLPTPFFIYYLWTWMKGVSEMDELQRRIELEALGFAFPAAVVFLMTIGLLDLAITLSPDDWSLHHVWLMLPLLYYAGLWRAKRRYE